MILKYKGINIFYTDQGKGTTIVLLHGFLENSTMWKDFTTKIAKNYRVVSIDLLGHGQTECLGYVHTMKDMSDAVEAVLNHLKIRKSIFIGHSMGGYVALVFAEHFPENVKGLCLINSTTKADSVERKKLRSRAVLAAKKEYKNLVRMSISNLFRPKNKILFKKEIKHVKQEALKTPLQGYIAAQEGMKLREGREVLLHFSPYKKMFVIGKKDPVLNYEELIEQTSNSEVEVVELSGGHMSHIENKEPLFAALKKFINFLIYFFLFSLPYSLFLL